MCHRPDQLHFTHIESRSTTALVAILLPSYLSYRAEDSPPFKRSRWLRNWAPTTNLTEHVLSCSTSFAPPSTQKSPQHLSVQKGSWCFPILKETAEKFFPLLDNNRIQAHRNSGITSCFSNKDGSHKNLRKTTLWGIHINSDNNPFLDNSQNVFVHIMTVIIGPPLH